MALLDETGGKPLTGYGSGANTGSPVATSEESAAMLVAAAETLVRDGKEMCLAGGGYEFAGPFCQDLVRTSLILRGEANRFAGSGAWSGAAQRWLNASNTALLVGAAGCGVFALATAGTGGVACAAIYAGASATSAASTIVTAKQVLSRKGTVLDDTSFVASLTGAICLARLRGDARKACGAVVGTIDGIFAFISTAQDLRNKRLQTMDR